MPEKSDVILEISWETKSGNYVLKFEQEVTNPSIVGGTKPFWYNLKTKIVSDIIRTLICVSQPKCAQQYIEIC